MLITLCSNFLKLSQLFKSFKFLYLCKVLVYLLSASIADVLFLLFISYRVTHAKLTSLKWTVLRRFWSKFTFIYTKLKLKICHTRWLSFKNDIGNMTTVFLDAVFKPFFKIVHDTGQQLTIDRTNFLTDGFIQIIQRMGFVSVNTRFQIPPK